MTTGTPQNIFHQKVPQVLTAIVTIMIAAGLVSCRKHDVNPPPIGSYDLKLVANNFVSPIALSESPDNTNRLFVVDQIGKVWIVNADGSKVSTPFIDIGSKMVSLMPSYDERGLLGLAFHPGYKHNGKFYLFYNAPARPGGPDPGVQWNNTIRVSEFKVSPFDPNRADISSERVILEVDHPQFNHNGGTIAFGPDGYLYISIGDGGNADDVGPGHVEDWYKKNTGGNGQDITQNLLGNVLRIDVNNRSGKKPYTIPSDNPFVGKDGLDEIFAYGFRNPYRFSFDMRGQHQLYLGDAGQSLYEEIDLVNKGGNYGWNVKEGTHCFNTDNDLIERTACPEKDPTNGSPLIDPVLEVNNLENPEGGVTNTIVGGNVYRGISIPFLFGKYIFGFFSTSEDEAAGQILLAKPSAVHLWSYEVLHLKSFPTNLHQFVKGFGQDENGEIYVLATKEIGPSGNTGKVYKLVFDK